MGGIYTPAQQRASKKYLDKPEIKERVSWKGKDRYVNDETFREIKRTQALVNYYKRKERKRLAEVSTSEVSTQSSGTETDEEVSLEIEILETELKMAECC
jgi:uncharacterized caspase-like protein